MTAGWRSITGPGDVDSGRVDSCDTGLLIELVFILISFSVIPRYDAKVGMALKMIDGRQVMREK